MARAQEFLNQKKAAERLGVNPKTLRAIVKSKRLAEIRVGANSPRYRAADLDALAGVPLPDERATAAPTLHERNRLALEAAASVARLIERGGFSAVDEGRLDNLRRFLVALVDQQEIRRR
jgi:hypothetical protein